MAIPIPIEPENFEHEVLMPDTLVLLLSVHEGSEYEEYMDVVRAAVQGFADRIKVCVIREEFIDAFKLRLGFEGTPTSIVFCGAEERGRLLGKTDEQTFADFLFRSAVPMKE